MRRAITLVSLLCLVAVSAGAAEDVVIRATLGAQEAWLGQRVRLTIDVLGTADWIRIEEVGELEIPGAYILRTESKGTRLKESIGDASYAGERYEVLLFNQRPGLVEVPPIPVTVEILQGSSQIQREMMTPATSFRSKTPPGAEGIRGLISTTRLTADQSWSSETDSVALGDAITRTVTLVGDGVSAMAFPPLSHPELEGVGIYPGEPVVSDQTSQGELQGERTETVTYVFEQPGEVTLPAVEQSWWSLRDESLQRIELPGLNLIVVGDTAPSPDATAATKTSPGHLLLLSGIGLAMLAIVVGLAWNLYRQLGAWRRVRRESEAAYFRKIAPAVRDQDPAVILATVMRWLDRLDLESRPARLDEFLRHFGDDETRAAAAQLTRCLASSSPFSHRSQLGRGLKRARSRHRDSRRSTAVAAHVLPELNRSRATGR